MVSFTISLVALVLGYFLYGRFVERVFGPDDRLTPAMVHPDGVDSIALSGWKIFMIQFLNIAGAGPIFGTIMGMWFGPSAYLWIVMLSLRNNGAGLPELIGKYLGGVTKKVMLVFSILLLVMVCVVFVYSPEIITGSIWGSKMIWIIIIFIDYILATMLSIDKIIGKIHPYYHHTHTSVVYDNGMFHISTCVAKCNWTQSDRVLWCRRVYAGNNVGMVFWMVL